MVNFNKLGEVYGMKVFTDSGYFFGEIEEAIIEENRIKSWKIKSLPNSILSKNIKDAKGIILPYKYFRAFGDIIIVRNIELGGKTTSMEEPLKEKI